MYKKIDTNITSTFINNNRAVTYTPSFGKELAIKCAILKLKITTRIGTKSIAVKYDNKTIDEVKPLSTQRYVYINITDTLSDCLKLGQNSYTLTFVVMPYNSIEFDSAQSSVLINYTSQNTKLKNNIYKEVDVGRAGKGEINLSTGSFKFIHSDANIKSGALAIGISHIYNSFFEQYSDLEKALMNDVGRGWKLNLQQYLIKEKYNEPDADYSTKTFVYLDGNGDKHIFKEQYFYVDEQKVKHYLMPSQITIDEDNELIYKLTINNIEKTYKVEKKVLSTSGFVLTTQLEDFQDIKFVQTNIDEIEEIKQQITSIENTNKQYKKALEQNEKSKKLLQASKNIESLQYSAQEKSSALEQSEINYALALKDKRKTFDALQNELQTLQSQIQQDQLDIQERQLSLQDSQIDIQEQQIELQGCQNDAQSAQITLSEKEKEYSQINNELQKLLEQKDEATASDENIKSKRTERDDCFKCLQDLKTGLIIKQIVVKSLSSNLEAAQNDLIILQEELQTKQKALQVRQEVLQDKQLAYNTAQKELIELENKHMWGDDSNGNKGTIGIRQEILSGNQSLIYASKEYSESQYNNQMDQLNSEIQTLNENISYNNDDLVKLNRQLDMLNKKVPVHYLTNKDGQTLGFAETGKEEDKGQVYRLVLIVDKWENAIQIEYNADNQITQVLEEKTAIALKYDKKTKKLTSITDERGRKSTYKYDNERLIGIVCSDDKAIEYSYDDNTHLQRVLTPEGYGYRFAYNNSRVISIEEISFTNKVEHNNVIKNATPIVNESVKISYNGGRSTTVESETGIVATYLFDNEGKPVTVYEKKTDFGSVDARSYDYQNGNVSYSITPLKYGEDYLNGSCYDGGGNTHDFCGHKTEHESYFGNNFCEDNILDGESFVLAAHRIDDPETKIITQEVGCVYREVTPQMIDVIKAANKKDFVLSAWAMADSAGVTRRCTCFSKNTIASNDVESEYIENADAIQRARRFELRAEVSYSNKSQKDEFYASFDWMQQDWQYCALPIVISENEQDDLKGIRVYFDYTSNISEAQLRDMCLKEGTWTYCEYNSDGLKTYDENSTNDYVTEYKYDDDGNPIQSIITGKNGIEGITKYEYNSHNALIRVIDYNGVVSENEYNDKGISIRTVTYHQDEPTNKFYDESLVDEKGNEIGELNEFGDKLCDYTTIPNSDLVTVSTYKNGDKIAFGYDHNDDTLLSVSASVEGHQNENVMGYTADVLTEYRANGTDIKFAYDGFGRQTNVEIAGKRYAESKYTKDISTGTAKIVTDCYTSDSEKETFEIVSDLNGKVEEIKYNGKTEVVNIYDTFDRVTCEKDERNNVQRIISYDKFENENKHKYIGLDRLFAVETDYDKQGKVLENRTQFDEIIRKSNYVYEATPEAKLKEIALSNGIIQTLHYDKLGRFNALSQKTGSMSFDKTLYYKQIGDHASNLVASEWFGKNGINKENLKYTYDEKGNIISIRENGELIVRYAYDGLSRLVREDNKKLDKTCVFAYDCGGNILYRKEYRFTLAETDALAGGNTITYEYPSEGWKDRLISYNGAQIGNYDALGNPRLYRGKQLVWSHGRHLDSIEDITYTYNTNGVRLSKTVNGKTTKFYADGTTILAQECDGNVIYFNYGADGINGFTVNGTEEYYYKKNVQGDILAVIDASGTEIAQYVYDAWGNHNTFVLDGTQYIDTSLSHAYTENGLNNKAISEMNPFRYRGYYYDTETGLYYLNARYYDSVVGRFINADDISYAEPDTINGLNLYAYCANNPVMYIDTTGSSWKSFWSGVGNWFKTNWKKVVTVVGSVAAIIGGAILIATGVGAIAGAALIGFGIGSIAGGFISEANGGSFVGGWAIGGLVGGILGGIAGYAAPLIGGLSFGTGGGLALAGGGSVGTGISVSGSQLAKSLLKVGVLFARIGNSGGYRIDHHYPDDHAPTHVHISGDDGKTKVDIFGNPIQRNRPMTPGERRAFKKLYKAILKALAPWL